MTPFWRNNGVILTFRVYWSVMLFVPSPDAIDRSSPGPRPCPHTWWWRAYGKGPHQIPAREAEKGTIFPDEITDSKAKVFFLGGVLEISGCCNLTYKSKQPINSSITVKFWYGLSCLSSCCCPIIDSRFIGFVSRCSSALLYTGTAALYDWLPSASEVILGVYSLSGKITWSL